MYVLSAILLTIKDKCVTSRSTPIIQCVGSSLGCYILVLRCNNGCRILILLSMPALSCGVSHGAGHVVVFSSRRVLAPELAEFARIVIRAVVGGSRVMQVSSESS